MITTPERNLYKVSDVRPHSKKQDHKMNPGLDMISAFIVRTTEISESLSRLPELIHETYTVRMDEKSNEIFMNKSFMTQSLSLITSKAKQYFGDDLYIKWHLNKEIGLYEVFLYNDNLTLEENYDRLDEFDTWWLSEGIEQSNNVVIYLR